MEVFEDGGVEFGRGCGVSSEENLIVLRFYQVVMI